MKFTDGYWKTREGLTVLRGTQIVGVRTSADTLTAYVAAGRVAGRGDTLNRPLLTVTLTGVADGVIRVRLAHHLGGLPAHPRFDVAGEGGSVVEGGRTLTAGRLSATFADDGDWLLTFRDGDRVVTSSIPRSIAHVTGPEGTFTHEQLTLDVGEYVYGLGERFGAFAKNGQVVDIWNEDGGTCSEQAYKNVPFYVSNRGYGVFVDSPDRVSFEVAGKWMSADVINVSSSGSSVAKGESLRDTALTLRAAGADGASSTTVGETFVECDMPLSWNRPARWHRLQEASSAMV